MNLGKPIRDEAPEPDEWIHEPTEACPHRYRNIKTGMYANRQPTPPPKVTNLPYLGPPVPNSGMEVTEVDIQLYMRLLDTDHDAFFEVF